MKAIVYTSKTGYTAAYAKLLSKKTGLSVYNLNEAKTNLAENTDIIYLGWLFASNIKGFKKASKRYNISAVCGVGLGDTGSQIYEVRNAAKIPENIPLFTLQGGMNLEKLSGIDKFLIKMLTKMLEKKDRSEDESKMLELVKKGGDYVCEENLSKVLQWYNSKL